MKKLKKNVVILTIFLGLSAQMMPPKFIIEEMLWVKGKEVKIGYDDGFENEKPSFYMHINDFYIDKNPVTVKQFRKFIKLTNYVTDAEKQEKGHSLDSLTSALITIKGANWIYPYGTNKPKSVDNQPVSQISWNDAKAYCTWVGKRLPTEFEWEFVLQNPKDYRLGEQKQYNWVWTDNYFRMYQEAGYRKYRLNETKTLKGGAFWDKKAKKTTQRPSLRIHHTPETSCANFIFYGAKNTDP